MLLKDVQWRPGIKDERDPECSFLNATFHLPDSGVLEIIRKGKRNPNPWGPYAAHIGTKTTGMKLIGAKLDAVEVQALLFHYLGGHNG